MPRPNLYQSLHTTVIHSGQTFEVQIRTHEMHRIAEQGVAAHWRYKDGKDVSDADDQRILWMRQLIEWVKEMQEPSEFMSTLKVDLYPEEVYAFTPKGKVLALPRGATPVDFAYAVHTEVGNQCIGAKVNGQIVPLRHRLSNGDVVEVLTQKGHVPSRDWLNFVRTSRARSKIRHHINFIERSQATEVGRRLLEREARQLGRSLKKIPEADLLRVASEYGCAKLEDLFADLGRAKCCNPIPGDEIVGYVTRGRGVAVHAKSCPNVENLLYQVERRIDVEWGGAAGSTYPVTLLIRAQDRPGMLADITSVISETGSNIRTLASQPDNLHARIDLTLEISDRKQLERIIVNIRKISGIFGVERLYKV
jgi:GTP pyrophosphokinase